MDSFVGVLMEVWLLQARTERPRGRLSSPMPNSPSIWRYGLGLPWVSPKEFSSVYGSQSGRSGAASAAANAGVPMELWGQHGDWKSVASQKAYMKRDPASILSVSRATMTSLKGDPFAAEPPAALLPLLAHAPPLEGPEEEALHLVVGVPEGSFAWHHTAS